MSESRCLLDVQVIGSPVGDYLASLPIHRAGCGHGAEFDTALEAFMSGPAEAWMEDRWWVSLDEGNLTIGSRAVATGRIEVPSGVPRTDWAANRRPVRSRRDFYESLGLDWSLVVGVRHATFGDHVLIYALDTAAVLHRLPDRYREFVDEEVAA
jgi:hypothetical protein